MSETAETAVPARGMRRRLSFIYLAGPLAWAVMLLAGYLLVHMACSISPRWLVYALAGATALIVLVAGGMALRGWRDATANAHHQIAITDLDADQPQPEGTRAFISISGALLSTLFFVMIVVTGVTIYFLSPCPIITMPLP